MIVQAAHLNRYQAWTFAVLAVHSTSAFRAKITGHLTPAICLDGESGCMSLDGDILFGEVCIGCVAGAGRFLTIEAMALHHHLGLSANGEGDSTATTTTCSKWRVGHTEFSLDTNFLTYFGTIHRGIREQSFSKFSR